MFDSDNSGYLSKEEFSNIMTNKGEMKLTLTEVEEMLAKVNFSVLLKLLRLNY